MFVFQFHLCEEKAGKHDVVYFREYWIFCHLRQRSRISSERQYTGLRKSVSPPCDSFMNKKMITCWKCFQVIGDEASKDEWVRDVCHFRRASKTDSMPRPPPSNFPPSWFDPNNNFQKWSGKSIECTSAMIRSKFSHLQNQFSLVPIWSSMIQRELRGLSKKARDWPFSISQTHSWLAWKDHRGYKSSPGRTNLWSFIDVHCAARGRGLHVLLIFLLSKVYCKLSSPFLLC